MTQNQIAYRRAIEEARHNVQQEKANREEAKANWMKAIANVAPYASTAVADTSEYLRETPGVWEWVQKNAGPGASHSIQNEDYKSMGSLIGGIGKLLSGLNSVFKDVAVSGIE